MGINDDARADSFLLAAGQSDQYPSTLLYLSRTAPWLVALRLPCLRTGFTIYGGADGPGCSVFTSLVESMTAVL